MERQVRRDLQAYLLVLQKVDLTAKIVDFADQRDVLLHNPHVVDPMNLADSRFQTEPHIHAFFEIESSSSSSSSSLKVEHSLEDETVTVILSELFPAKLP